MSNHVDGSHLAGDAVCMVAGFLRLFLFLSVFTLNPKPETLNSHDSGVELERQLYSELDLEKQT